MVDLALLQSVSYIVGALGVCVAAIYYAMVLREQRRNMRLTLETRRIGLIDSITNRLVTENTMNSFLELMTYEWKDYEDFEKKYGSDNNVDAAAKRFGLWISYNSMGAMLRKGLVEAEDLYDLGVQGAIFLWGKYKAVIEENRRRFNGLDYLRDFEYLAGEMMRVKLLRDPSFRLPETFYKYVPDKSSSQ
jgi:hypothetical protein